MLSKQFFESSRGRIVALLQHGDLTVENIAVQIGVTPNAVRSLLTAMERDGLVRRSGKRHAGATRPSHLFELTPEVQQLLSRAYVPLLTNLLHVVTTRESPAQMNKLLREVGKSLAASLVVRKRPPTEPLSLRAEAASDLLNRELGAVTHAVKGNGGYVIRGVGCPLSAITGKHPAVCVAIESFVKEVVGAPVRECCDRTGRPHCCFHIGGNAK